MPSERRIKHPIAPGPVSEQASLRDDLGEMYLRAFVVLEFFSNFTFSCIEGGKKSLFVALIDELYTFDLMKIRIKNLP